MAPRQTSDYVEEKIQALRWGDKRRRILVIPSVGTVWAIVLIVACAVRCSPAVSLDGVPCRSYDVLLTRYSSTYHPRMYRAVLATDGTRQRIAFYWLDPAMECEQTDSLAFSDFLFYPDKVVYWHHNDPNGTCALPLGSRQADRLVPLPTDNALQSILQSVFSMVAHNRTAPAGHDSTPEAARFFQGGRERARFDYIVTPPTAEHSPNPPVPERATDDGRVFNQLPFGRTYSKQADPDGNVVWRASKVSARQDLVRMIVRPRPLDDGPGWSHVFDPNTLGLWSAVPKRYRAYFSLKRRSVALRRKPSVLEAQRLHADIVSCLEGPLPDEVDLALHKLCFKASLETASGATMSSAARAYFDTYVRLAREPVNKIIVELGRITEGLRKKWSNDETRDFVLPLLRPLIDPKVFGDRGFVKEAIFEEIQLRNWSWYGRLVLENIREVASLDVQFLADLAKIVESTNLTTGSMDAQPSELTPSMKCFLQYLHQPPPAGQMTYDELVGLIEEAVSEASRQDGPDNRHEFCRTVAGHIRLLAGIGPFVADAQKLRHSISVCNERYASSRVTPQEKAVALAVFIALSFYDTSTSQDHDVLWRQLIEVSNTLYAQVEKTLHTCGYTEKTGGAQICRIWNDSIARLRNLVDDPLWPMFKFPLSVDERAELVKRLNADMYNVERAARVFAACVEKGKDTSAAARSIETWIRYLAQRVPAAVIILRLPGVQATVAKGPEGLPLIVLRPRRHDNPEQASRVMKELKHFYLGHRTGEGTPGTSTGSEEAP